MLSNRFLTVVSVFCFLLRSTHGMAELISITPSPVEEAAREKIIKDYVTLLPQLYNEAQKYAENLDVFRQKILFSHQKELPEEIRNLGNQAAELERKIIAPTTEDLQTYSQFLAHPNTGLTRLFPSDQEDNRLAAGTTPLNFLFTRGGGSFFQFKDRTHFFGYGSDITYRVFYKDRKGTLDYAYFRADFVDGQLGFLGELGLQDIRDNNAIDSHPIVQFARAYRPPANRNLWLGEQDRFWSNSVTTFNPFAPLAQNTPIETSHFSIKQPAMVGATYVVRSLIQDRYDILVAFQVIRQDPRDKSIIIAWKLLEDYNLENVRRPNRLNKDVFDGFPGRDGKDGQIQISISGSEKQLAWPQVISMRAKYDALLNSETYRDRIKNTSP